MRMQENTKQQLGKMKNGTLMDSQSQKRQRSVKGSTRPTESDFHSSSVNAKITRPPFGGIRLCQAGGKKAHHLTRIKETGCRQAAPVPSRAVMDGK